MSKLSISVVFYNEEKLILSCIDAITSEMENFKDQIELILIDNASTDHSLGIVENWKRQYSSWNINLIKRQENHLGQARQQALLEGKSPYLAFIDTDCEMKPGWAKAVMSLVSDWPQGVGAFGGASEYIKSEEWHHYVSLLGKKEPWSQQGGIDKKVNHLPTNNYLVDRELALKVGGFRSYFHPVGEDLDFNMRLSQQAYITYTPRFAIKHQLPSSYRMWMRKMYLYGTAQSQVFVLNRGHLPLTRFLPLGFVVLFLAALYSGFWSVLGGVFLIGLWSRSRFLLLSILSYGFGEVVGFFNAMKLYFFATSS